MNKSIQPSSLSPELVLQKSFCSAAEGLSDIVRRWRSTMVEIIPRCVASAMEGSRLVLARLKKILIMPPGTSRTKSLSATLALLLGSAKASLQPIPLQRTV